MVALLQAIPTGLVDPWSFLEPGPSFETVVPHPQPVLALKSPRPVQPKSQPLLFSTAPGCGFRGCFFTGQEVAIKTSIPASARGWSQSAASKREGRGPNFAQQLERRCVAGPNPADRQMGVNCWVSAAVGKAPGSSYHLVLRPLPCDPEHCPPKWERNI